MAKKEFVFHGMKIEELKALSVEEFAKLIPSAQRRKIKRGFTDAEKALLKDVEKNPKNVKTHCRDMIILPSFVGLTMKIHNGKDFKDLLVTEFMIGHRLGEFALSRAKVKHGSVGVASAIKH